MTDVAALGHALAVMEDDGWGCAITTTTDDSSQEQQRREERHHQ